MTDLPTIILLVMCQVLALMVGYWLRGYVDQQSQDDWHRTLEKERKRRAATNDWLDSRYDWPHTSDEQMAPWAEEDEWEVQGDDER